MSEETDIDNMYSKVNPQNKNQKNTTKNTTNVENGLYGEVKMLENDIYNEQLPKGTDNEQADREASKSVEADLASTGTYSEVKIQENDIYNQKSEVENCLNSI